MKNETSVAEFILLGLSSDPEAQILLFGLFLIIYLVALVANILIFLLISFDKRLHNPMYFFLGNLSIVDIGYITSTVPKMLMNYVSQDKRISLAGCFSQMYFFISFGGVECLLLGVMAYDRYAAICHPLHYSVLMSPKTCALLASASWILGLSNSGVHVGMMTRLSFCKNYVIQHFFCDIPPLFQLSCSDTQVNQIVTFVVGGGVIMGSFLVTLVSYVYIVFTILRIRTKEGRHKAFSTCTSHLTVVNIYFGTIIFTYIRPNSTYSQEQDRLHSTLRNIHFNNGAGHEVQYVNGKLLNKGYDIVNWILFPNQSFIKAKVGKMSPIQGFFVKEDVIKWNSRFNQVRMNCLR
ncbi:hypothetical protein JRQ81_005537 [Phrynocephalus forsythii]|uniref:Olfactory receptor n=1 Tax=Phrynocephalus forsythii TaxID=171643 RepID=A0A9Q1AVA4_9SAUR|nr:hypothetical protein JRQ81_005537 [Phrynocephalus forsythii]